MAAAMEGDLGVLHGERHDVCRVRFAEGKSRYQDYLNGIGNTESKAYVLEDGFRGWKYPDLVNTVDPGTSNRPNTCM